MSALLPHEHDGQHPFTGPSDPVLERQRARESSARSYPRRLPLVIESASGVTVRDIDGREYIDCLAGAGVLALGHNHPAVVEAVERALRSEIPFSTLDITTPTKEAFVDTLFATLPPSLADGRIQFCGPSGADAVEAAVKLVKTATGRTGTIAFGGAYHGMTQATLALTGARGPKEHLGALLPDVHHLPFPSAYRCPFGIGGDESARVAANVVRWALLDDHSGITRPAGVIMEPVQGEGGVHPAPPEFARTVRDVTERAGVPLIYDEVQSGVGRTGTMWAFEQLGVEPDVLVLSKAIGGGLPLAVVVYREELDVWSAGAHAGTFRGNQLAMAAGTATIRYLLENDLTSAARERGEQLLDGLRFAATGIDQIGDVRGRGLMAGVEMVDPDLLDAGGMPEPDGGFARAVQQELFARGVIAEVGGRNDAVVRFLPPLVIDEATTDRVIAAFAETVREVRARARGDR